MTEELKKVGVIETPKKQLYVKMVMRNLKRLIKKAKPNMDKIKDVDEFLDDIICSNDVYCKICSSCGEEGCCIPTICQNNKEGMYCEINLSAMKVSYCTLKDFYNWLYENEEANKYIIDKLNEIEDKVESEFNTQS